MKVLIEVPQEPPILFQLRMTETELYEFEDILACLSELAPGRLSEDQIVFVRRLAEMVAGATAGVNQKGII